MEQEKILVYDGSFNGFLTSVFTAFEEKINVVDIQRKNEIQKGLFTETQIILTQLSKAKRVWNGLSKRSNTAIKNIYFAFLSETHGIEKLLFSYIKKIVAKEESNPIELTDEMLFKINNLAAIVGKKKNQMEAFTKFQVSKDGVHFIIAEPEFDLIPLVSKHFRYHFSDRQWIIYDIKRNYGLYFNLKTVQIISLDPKAVFTNKASFKSNEHSGLSGAITLWNSYFANNSIKSLIAQRPHTYQMPKRQRDIREKREAV
ncbi:TIGR03915 family putative DNA repair protein [uncultured Eudoraea sp.]|uniref:TIGR03915 family putative DNA repair protein n=1 Tax=uncultured Eudoraea sp. TaxID=1035614 RepID=UPI0026118EEC|nr:TIGR03915 family putative DNA repair protein [uncultured Eudoraea sp.]